MTPDQQAMLSRLRRKLEIMRMDNKNVGDPIRGDIRECLLLVDMIETACG